MGYNELELEIHKLVEQISRWRTLGCVPLIEQGIALGRLQKLYTMLLDMPVTESEITEPVPVPAPHQDEHPVSEPEEEETSEAEEHVSESDDEPGDRTSSGMMMKQQYGAHDECPPETFETEPEPPKETSEPARPAFPEPPVRRIFGIEVTPAERQAIIDTLFDGDETLFTEECDRFHHMGSLEDALVYIGETFEWEPGHPVTAQFVELLETRFS